LKPGELTLIYGEAETGKTSLAIQCSINSARMGCKTIFVDADGTFSLERFSQIAAQDFNETLQFLILFTPSTFNEQSKLVDDLEKCIGGDLGLIIFDTITSLYRAEIGGKEDAFKINRELNRQVAMLAHIAKKFQIPILITSQVRSILANNVFIEPAASRVLRYWATSVIGLFKTGRAGIVRADIEKVYNVEKRMTIYLSVSGSGVREYEGIKSMV
ncbi:MAG: AAA family ATPase, partial [Candidatus Bathyarchaeota archaeon]|nr:AAA family ATPase [Candidatus Bathyarchaeota archaeon]